MLKVYNKMTSRRVLASLRVQCAGFTQSACSGREIGRPKLCVFRDFNTKYSLWSSLPSRAVSRNRAWSSYRAPATSRDEDYNKVLSHFDYDAPLIATWGNDVPLTSTFSNDGHVVSARWSDGEEQDYPGVWLRDNCRCVDCCHQESITRKIYLTEMSLETKIKDVSLLDDGHILSVEWSDGHRGVFPSDWLRGHRFDQSQPDPIIEDTRPHLWGSDVMSTPHFRMFEFDEVMESDSALYDWLKMLFSLGIAVLKKAPTEQGQQYRLQNRLGYDSPAPSSSGILNQAKLHFKSHHPLFTEKRLQLHNDLTYYTQAKGFELFHCIKQVSGGGGDSLLADGFKVAQDLRSQNPEAFQILSTVPWEYKLEVGKIYHNTRREVIRLDKEGDISQITVNDICRTSMLRIHLGDVRKAYEALKEFTIMLYHPDNLCCYRLEAGDILAFHNHRILHGRLGFSLQADTQRHLENCYSDWEIVSGRLRQLQKQRLLANGKSRDE